MSRSCVVCGSALTPSRTTDRKSSSKRHVRFGGDLVAQAPLVNLPLIEN